jgi:hypothetical protein
MVVVALLLSCYRIWMEQTTVTYKNAKPFPFGFFEIETDRDSVCTWQRYAAHLHILGEKRSGGVHRHM